MKIIQRLAILILPIAILIPSISNATIALPALDIQNFGTDSGMSLTATTLNIGATAFSIATSGTPIDIPDVAFSLSSSSGSYNAGTGSFNGNITIGSLLTADFTQLSIYDLAGGDYQFFGDVTYTGGSMMGNLTTGRIGGVANANSVIAKLGQITVVPVPAALWLFGSGLLGLAGIARRKAS